MLNSVDQQLTRTMLHAENYCRNINNGDILFSPQLNEYGSIWSFWKRILKIKESNKRFPKYIICEAKALGIRIYNAMSTKKILRATSKAKSTYL